MLSNLSGIFCFFISVNLDLYVLFAPARLFDYRQNL
ncbi:hypothetical protein BA1DRAFT_02390 [Photorhabdus aegyptia]|uniref:Uncharacterized protein n=1 Tax=Photorhabdus aegyptia TaxID=2805098 RepID=A0A022PKS3_9GAMM|nr:hypothetical protein BA1DRAFT_02390 [Photorhabdus aegyptia]